METALEFYINKITNFESMGFEQRRAAVLEVGATNKLHTKASLKAIFRVKPKSDAKSGYRYKNPFGGYVECYSIDQCVAMKKLPSKKRSKAQIDTTEKLKRMNIANSNRNKVALFARQSVDSNRIVCLDTETTSLDGQVVQIALVCLATAELLFESYVKPDEPISYEAYQVHGITEDDVADAPSFELVATEISKIMIGKSWVAFNSAFDYQAMMNSAHDKEAECYRWVGNVGFCAMYDVAAPFFGATNKYGSISLSRSMACSGVDFEGQAHSASGDAIGTVRMLHYIANQAR